MLNRQKSSNLRKRVAREETESSAEVKAGMDLWRGEEQEIEVEEMEEEEMELEEEEVRREC